MKIVRAVIAVVSAAVLMVGALGWRVRSDALSHEPCVTRDATCVSVLECER